LNLRKTGISRASLDSLLEFFCDVDDFCKRFLPICQSRAAHQQRNEGNTRKSLSVGEIMTVLVDFAGCIIVISRRIIPICIMS